MIYDLQKASLMKRFSAFLLDAICVIILATFFAWILSIVVNYNGWTQRYETLKTAWEQKYGIDSLTKEEYDALTDEEKAEYDTKNEQARQEADRALQEAYRAKDPEAVETVKVISVVNNLMLLIISIGTFLSFIVVEFVVPLCLKNGQTVGKKVFAIAVMRNNSVRVNGIILFIRNILGKYTIETMIPLYIAIKIFITGNGGILDLVLLAALAISQIVIFFATKTFSFLHDLLAGTVSVDISTQMIFESEEARIAYIEEKHAEEAKNDTY